MKDKTTGDLKQELMSDADFDGYIKKNESHFSNKRVADLLNELHGKRHMSKTALARDAGMSEVDLHQPFAGKA